MLCEDGLIENHYYDYGYLLTADYSAAGALRKVRRISYTCMGTTYIILLYIYLLLKFRSDKSRTGDYFLRLDPSPWHVYRPLSSKILIAIRTGSSWRRHWPEVSAHYYNDVNEIMSLPAGDCRRTRQRRHGKVKAVRGQWTATIAKRNRIQYRVDRLNHRRVIGTHNIVSDKCLMYIAYNTHCNDNDIIFFIPRH